MHLVFFRLFSRVEKRIRMLIATIVITFLMLVFSFFFFDKAIFFVPIAIVFTYFLTYFSLLEGVSGIEWFTLFLMPMVIVIAYYFFYFLFPGRWLTRIPFLFFLAVSVYANLLVSNIFNVGVEKSLQLYRAAFSVNYFYQTILLFILGNVLFSLKLPFYINTVFFFIVGSIFAIQLFWSIKLDQFIDKRILRYGLLMGWMVAQIVLMISFIPLQSTMSSLAVSAGYYIIAGVTYLYLDARLFKTTVREYVTVLVFIIGIVILSVKW